MCIPDAMVVAIDDEIREVRRRLGDLARVRLELTSGQLLESTPGAFVYEFACRALEDREAGDESNATPDAAYQVPEDASGMIMADGRSVPTVVLMHDPATRRITVELQLYAPLVKPDRVELTFSTIFLLTALQARLRACQAAPSRLVAGALRGKGDSMATNGSTPLAGAGSDQAEVVRFALASSVTYVWGPPGTGKTRTLAHLIRQLLEARETILVTASTNVAVDRLVESTLDVLGSPERSPIIRLGRVGRALRGRGVSPEDILARDESFRVGAEQFERTVRTLNIPSPERWTFDTLLRVAGWVLTAGDVLSGNISAGTLLGLVDMAKAICDAVDSRTLEVPAIAATLCGTYVRPQLSARTFDTVIVDEASMASVAQFVAAASLAKRRIVVAGDFQQLPPIVLARTPNARRYLGQHVFSFAGCDDVRRDHPLRRMLRQQWRMHPDISRVVSRVFYGGQLTDAPPVMARVRRGAASRALLVDTHGLGPRTTRTPSRSIRNSSHAQLIADWLAGARWQSIGVIAPYRAQARTIRAALRTRCRARVEDGSIQVSTVHKFQGEERDLIVFDTTDAPGASGHFLNDARNPSAANLINVAISRARHALVVVGDVPHVRRHLGPESAIHRVMLELMSQGATEVDASDAPDLERLRAFLFGSALPA